MPLNSSGPISIGGSTTGQSINLAVGRTATQASNLNETLLRNTAGKPTAGSAISLSDFYGKPVFGSTWYNEPTPVVSDYTTGMACTSNGQTIVIASNLLDGTRPTISTDYGYTFSTLSGAPSLRMNNGVAISGTGSVIALADGVWSGLGGYLHISTNSGVSFTQRGTQQSWSYIAMSSDGTRMIATTDDDKVFTSSDTGTTWTQRTTPTVDYWFATIRASDTLQYIIIGEMYGAAFISSNYGVSWVKRSLTNQWGNPIQTDGVACSANGSIMYISAYSGEIMKSTDYGATFTQMADVGYQSSTSDCDSTGNKFIAGNSNGNANLIYTSNAMSSYTAINPGGNISGGMNGDLRVSRDGTRAYIVGCYGDFYRMMP